MAAAEPAAGPSSAFAAVASLGGLLDGQSPGVQLLVLGLVVFHIGAIVVWALGVSRELRHGDIRKRN